MATISKAIDKRPAGEARKTKADGYEPILTNTRWFIVEAYLESVRKTGMEVEGSIAIQPALRSVLFTKGSVSATLDLHVSVLGRPVSG